ncbi:hypothetical protein [Paludisphaera rhizosphaerae]|uniref:hypothetical protein n=1 Tax=Paludisphaera rhizosphaerae TaxID=2711216 RepID=UPI0013ED479E|nr:hypothetical protein [Paludisphaera rhizosphaerae]
MERRSEARAVWSAAGLVVGAWVVCLAAAFVAFRLSAALDEEGVPVNWTERLGQFGDTFGLVNALFTGVALVGVAYTVHLQREEAEENREWIRREGREQFLSARLNAVVAMLDAHGRKMAASRDESVGEDYYLHALKSEDDKLRQQIAFLRSEVRLGFDGEWTPEVGRRAVALHLLQFVETELRCFTGACGCYADEEAGGTDHLSVERRFKEYLRDMRGHVRREFSLLASQPEPECFDVYELVKPELDQWSAAVDRALAAPDIHPAEVEARFRSLTAHLARM